jgi:hypothetical protein
MFGCAGREASTADASFDFATDEGRVSGSKSALRTRASLADRTEDEAETASIDIV